MCMLPTCRVGVRHTVSVLLCSNLPSILKVASSGSLQSRGEGCRDMSSLESDGTPVQEWEDGHRRFSRILE
jgi:hypothetical protein